MPRGELSYGFDSTRLWTSDKGAMISSSQLGAGYALVPVAPVPDWAVSNGGGPIRKAGGLAVRAHAGNTVYRTPHAVVREAEPGASWEGDLSNQMFLPDGRLVPATGMAFDMLQGTPEVPGHFDLNLRKTLGPSVTMVIGAGAGMLLTRDSQHRIAGTIVGALAGGVLGLIFG